MAKGKYYTHVEPRFEEIKRWCERGATNKEIMKALGIGESAFYDYLKKHKEFAELIKKNRISAIEEIKYALFKRATGFDYSEVKKTTQEIELNKELSDALKDAGVDFLSIEKPMLIKTEEIRKYALPDVAAGMVLLKQWAKCEGWTNDPQILKVRKDELKLKKEQANKDDW